MRQNPFIGGMIVSSAKETHWVHHSLSSLRVIFIAFFFVSVGMLLDLEFIKIYLWQIIALILAAYVSNLLINAVILKLLGENWPVSLYGGALLSQIGKFSFVIAAVGYQLHIIDHVSYQITISVISLSLLFSPMWIMVTKRLTNIKELRLEKG